MELKFIYSDIYFRQLNKHRSVERTWPEVKEIGQKFEQEYKSEIEEIVEIIPELLEEPWERETMRVYFVDWKGPSFSSPLTLKVREDLLLMLVVLTHELLHDFYSGKKDIETIEEMINKNVKRVFEKINLNVDEQLETLQYFHDKRFNKEE